MKKFLLLLLVTIVTIACGPLDPYRQKYDENIRLGDVKYCYQLIDGNLVMTIAGTDQYGTIIHDIIPVSFKSKVDTINIPLSKEAFLKEYDKYVEWYIQNHLNDYNYDEIKEAIDIVNQILKEYNE